MTSKDDDDDEFFAFGFSKAREQSFFVLERVLIWSDSRKEAAATTDESRQTKRRAYTAI